MWPFPEIRNLADIVRYNARKHPDKAALLFEDNITSMAEMDMLTSQLANGLVGEGVKHRDRVVYLGANSDDFMLALYGVSKAAACIVPTNWRLSESELSRVVNDCEPSFAFIEDVHSAKWQEILRVSGLDIKTVYISPGDTSTSPFREWLGKQGTQDPYKTISSDDNAWLLYTSGTTGLPKGVELMHSGLIHMRICEHLEPAYVWSKEDNFLFCSPNFHLFGIGLANQALYNGATISIVKQYDPELVLKEIVAKKATIIALVPVMIQMLLDHPGCESTDLSSVREVVYAGSSISLALIQRAIEKMPCRFMQFYGSTESGGAITLLRPEEHDLSNPKRLTSCGKPLPFVDIRITDDLGNDLPAGTPGQMLVRTPGINGGYWRKPEAWKEVYHNGWYNTGDVACCDADGFYYIVDRQKDMIITGGENVYSSEVENCISLHPAVQKVAAVGVPSKKWGEEVKVFIIVNDAYSLSEKEIIDFSKKSLAAYKCPKSVDFVDMFPMNPTGKVLKRELRAPYWKDKEKVI